MAPENFEWSYTEEPHATRRKNILQAYPNVKKYFGADASFKYVVTAMALYQVFMAYLIKDSNWLLVVLQSYFVSGTINHSLTLAVHECSHNVAFGHSLPFANRIVGFIANLPMCVPMSISFKKYHAEHHRHLGEDVLDTDVPTELEARLFTGRIGKLIWLCLQPVFYSFRPLTIYKKAVLDLEILNFAIEIVFVVTIYRFFGIKSVFYLAGGLLMGLGLHPLSAHFISDHCILRSGQETNSYYGILNMVSFNVGYHVEHHDFPYVSARNLPKVHAMAREFYTDQVVHESWTGVLYNFVVNESVGLRSRTKRKLAQPTEYRFYDVGAHSSTYLFDSVKCLFATVSTISSFNLKKLASVNPKSE